MRNSLNRNRWDLKEGKILNELHFHAAGDFMLMSRNNFHRLRGYPEFPTNTFIDGYIVCIAKSSGLSQIILRDPIRIYHQFHFFGRKGMPSIDYFKFLNSCSKMVKQKHPLLINDGNWGFGNIVLPEHVY